MTKKILIIFIVVLLLVIAGLVGYNLAMRKARIGEKEPTELTPSGPPITAGIGPQALPKIMPLTSQPVLSPSLTADEKKVRYYLKESGKIYEVSFNGSEITEVSGNILKDLVNVLWSPGKDKAINIFRDKKYLYDFRQGKAILYNKNIGPITWSPDGQKIAYLYRQGDENVISVANPDSTGYKDIFRTRMEDLILEWVPGKISLRQPTSGLASGILYALNPQTKKLTKVISTSYGLNVRWAPDGQKLVYTSTTAKGRQITLYLINADGSGLRDLALATMVEKCAFSENGLVIYCAVPASIPLGMIMPDDWYKGIFLSQDSFFKIDVETGQKIKVASGNYDATDLFPSADGDKLFFINKNDGLLYVINL